MLDKLIHCFGGSGFKSPLGLWQASLIFLRNIWLSCPSASTNGRETQKYSPNTSDKTKGLSWQAPMHWRSPTAPSEEKVEAISRIQRKYSRDDSPLLNQEQTEGSLYHALLTRINSPAKQSKPHLSSESTAITFSTNQKRSSVGDRATTLWKTSGLLKPQSPSPLAPLPPRPCTS